MAQTVRVRLRKPNRVMTFINKDNPLERNTHCVVRSDRGLEYGVCILPPEECTPETEDRFKMPVVRRASHHDTVTYTQILDDEDRAKRMCAEKIRERKLPMKLVECEYTFDRKKVIFYFTADDRVDFRELVRDLAQELKTRIELRHIQVRDEAKMVGGIGTCGRELCCTTWLTDFMPISMKMAKRQNLSLNPSKISGQCGRLMCCLSYENDMYSREKKKQRPVQPPNPEELSQVRDKMEAAGPEAAEKLKDRAEGGERPRRDRRPKRDDRPPRPQPDAAPEPEQKRIDAPQPAESETKPAENTEGTGTEAPKRRRRRRRRGKSGGQGGNSGGGE